MTYSIKQVLFDPFGKGAYLLASDGSDSAVWYTPDVYAAVKVWTKGVTTPGEYTVIRTTNVPGSIFIYGSAVTLPPSDCAPFYYNFRSQIYDWVIEVGTETAGEGVVGAWDGYEMMSEIRLDCTEAIDPNSTITVAWYNEGTEYLSDHMMVFWFDSGMNQLRSEMSTGMGAGENSYVFSTLGTTGAVTIRWRLYGSPNGRVLITRSLEITNP